MKLITMALFCLLVARMWLQDVDGRSFHVPSSNCCFNFVKKRISLGKIQCYRNSSSSCSNPDVVILKMNEGMESCAWKTTRWVKDSLQKIKPCP
ncbi:C-C motif chemokine 1 [Rousettus aegyptiacus]|uniref:C-C motif chemokine 1 n=1 Tax=Rousettus aegyptiacus TaxID=9407 RepID=A0A7J8G5I7_ROUAE|nr:C-C motif chemokine 1 [Rousettus aegyptiacus]KAF6455176.1 C-C motif chemokine ligand 1 [Rousettus aegyptiacus]